MVVSGGGAGCRIEGLFLTLSSSSSEKKGSPGVTGRRRRCSWRKRKARKGGGSDGMQPSSKCALSKACCCSLGGGPREGLVLLAAGRRPPSHSTRWSPTSASRSLHASTHLHPPHPPGQPVLGGLLGLLGLQKQDDGSRPPLCGRSCQGPREPQGPRITGRHRATRLSALRTLPSQVADWLVRHLPIRPDQTRAAQYAYGNGQDPLLSSGSALVQSREFRTLRPITILSLSYNAHGQ